MSTSLTCAVWMGFQKNKNCNKIGACLNQGCNPSYFHLCIVYRKWRLRFCWLTITKTSPHVMYLDSVQTRFYSLLPGISAGGDQPERASHRLVVHARLVLLLAPQTRHGFGVEQFEDASLSVSPLDVAWAVVATLQQRQQELPQILCTLATPFRAALACRSARTPLVCNISSVQWRRQTLKRTERTPTLSNADRKRLLQGVEQEIQNTICENWEWDWHDNNGKPEKLDWSSCGYTSHSTQISSFRRRSSQPISWLRTEKLKQTQQKQTRIRNKIYYQHKINPQKTKARFSRLLRHPEMEMERAYSGFGAS